MFSLVEIGAAYIIINGVSAREERKTIVLTGVNRAHAFTMLYINGIHNINIFTHHV